MPFFIFLFSAAMLGERVTPFAVAGAVLALIGVAVISVIAVAIGIAIAHESFGPREAIGAILVIIGVGLALAQQQNAAAVAGATDTTAA